jgi:LCP family protein required for cell wall assembly
MGGIEGGGPMRVARVVKSLTGMQVHHVLYVNLAGFQGLVDALGGVDMCVPYPMYDVLTLLDIPAGCQHFDGATALAYVRTRHQPCDAVPDFARISRQQQFLRAVISRLLTPGELLRLPTLVPELLDNLVVDEGLRNPAELVYLAGQLGGVTTDAAQFRAVPTIPAGIYVNGQYLSIVKMLEPEAAQLFARIKGGRPLGDLGAELSSTAPSPANVVVQVVDRRPARSRPRPSMCSPGRLHHAGIVQGASFDSPVKVGDRVPRGPESGQGRRDLLRISTWSPRRGLPPGVMSPWCSRRHAPPPPATEPPVGVLGGRGTSSRAANTSGRYRV